MEPSEEPKAAQARIQLLEAAITAFLSSDLTPADRPVHEFRKKQVDALRRVVSAGKKEASHANA